MLNIEEIQENDNEMDRDTVYARLKNNAMDILSTIKDDPTNPEVQEKIDSDENEMIRFILYSALAERTNSKQIVSKYIEKLMSTGKIDKDRAEIIKQIENRAQKNNLFLDKFFYLNLAKIEWKNRLGEIYKDKDTEEISI